MEDFIKRYETWLNHPNLEKELYQELQAIKDNLEGIEERFYKDLEFGTGGLRGIIGAGTNRMNVYTIRKATMGLANYILKQGNEAMQRGVAIAFDSRKFSKDFAKEAARVLASNKIKVYLFEELRPTPLLSFAVRYLQTFAGIVITASHNPPEYNGYKVYNQDGNQITEEMANEIYQEIQMVDNPLNVQMENFQTLFAEKLITYISDEVDQVYDRMVRSLLLNFDLIQRKGNDITIVYTPLHGTGNKPVRRILTNVGLKNVFVVPQQELPDPRFSTVKAPNPEEREVFRLAIQLANEKNADIIMATDPDADRLGVLVKIGDEYQALNGNQLGAIILYYLLQQKSHQGILPKNAALVKTIVTSDLGEAIASKFGVVTENTLTGFKYIGEKIKEYQESGSHTFIFGYEESYGYLVGDFVRDKDAVQITVIVAEMALYYKEQGKTLFDVLEEIYQEFGYYMEDLVSVTLKGIEGNQKIQEIVASFRDNPPKEIQGIRVSYIEDYKLGLKQDLLTGEKSKLTLPNSNVIKMVMEDQSWFTVRPSGTEPKIKLYFSVVTPSREESQFRLSQLKATVLEKANLK
ncbi:phospho-sugar mutase [Tepidibacillus fermentans]|uniref:Phosphoglucomutase n=1 Tax=Tepidibacillus fermentans TaxID=1281767 RepID=A0A4R3KK83_9BACI|nr:phospho-sugar mutase [Tepidibacillus fermentans]TCS84203.1 alpha-phosphoglucomutase [Tepidibacillus fermentans]